MLLDDHPALPALAHALVHPWSTLPEEYAEWLEPLAAYLIDRRDLPPLGLRPELAGARAAMAAESPDPAERWRRRGEARVQVLAPAPWDTRAASLLADHGIRVGPHDPDVRIVVHVGEPEPHLLAEVGRDQVAHVWAGTFANVAMAGPFVDPGRTACRYCVLAHRHDRGLESVLTRHQHARPVGTPEPADPARLQWAISWAVADVVRWVDGDRPSLWSRSVEIDAGLEVSSSTWRRHARCGCSWSEPWLGRSAG